MLSETKTDNEKFRLDDEFFQKGYLKAYLDIKSKPSSKVGEVIDILTDYHANGSYENLNNHVKILDQEDYAYMIRSTDLEKRDFQNDVKYVSRSAYEFLSKTKLYGGEILINKIGSPGRVYLMPSLDKPATLGMNLFMIRLKKDSTFNEKFVWAFFHSSLGQKIIYRKVNGTVPLTIDKEAVKSLYLPKLSKELQDLIGISVEKSEGCLKESKITYNKAEALLLKSLGLENFSPSNKNTNIKSFKDAFQATGRIDAEYYQPKYDQLIKHLKNHQNGFFYLHEIAETLRGVFVSDELYEESGKVPYIRGADISSNKLERDKLVYVDSFLDQNQKDKCLEGDITFSLIGSVGTASIVTKDFVGSLVSNNLGIIRSKCTSEINPLVLHLFLTHKRVGWELFSQQEMRTAQPKISDKNIHNFPIPKIDPKTQSQISSLIQESFILKSKSEKLLEVAKQGIEMAIEESEEAAIKFINHNNLSR